MALLLTGALHGTKHAVGRHLGTFRKYDWIWKEDKDAAFKSFVAGHPTAAEYEAELRRFSLVEDALAAVDDVHAIGALAVNTANLKLQLRTESRQWKMQYAAKTHAQAKEAMTNLVEYIKVTQSKLKLEVPSIGFIHSLLFLLLL